MYEAARLYPLYFKHLRMNKGDSGALPILLMSDNRHYASLKVVEGK